ncbi:LOB domain-containing protein 20 [Elaeis guineensis]
MDSKGGGGGGGGGGPRGDAGKRAASAGQSAPCGACKFLRRKCVSGCLFAPHFGTEQGAARFAAVHKVFGASNVSKLLAHVPAGRRGDAVLTICYEAQARLADPVYGCVSTILSLQQQVAALQAEISIVRSQLINTRLAVAGALHQGSQQVQHIAVLQPAYSSNSWTCHNMVDLSSFASGLDLGDTKPTSRGFEPLQRSQPSNDEEEEDENQNPAAFASSVSHPK